MTNIDLQNCEIVAIDFHGGLENILVANPIFHDRSSDQYYTLSERGKPKYFHGNDVEYLRTRKHQFLVPKMVTPIPAFADAKGLYCGSQLFDIVQEHAEREGKDSERDLTPWQKVPILIATVHSHIGLYARIAFGKKEIVHQRAEEFASYLLAAADEELKSFYGGGQLRTSYADYPLAYHLADVAEKLSRKAEVQRQATYRMLLMAVNREGSFRRIWDQSMKGKLKTAIRRFRKFRSLDVSDEEINLKVFSIHYHFGGI